MNKRIYKYELGNDEFQLIDMPINSKILCVQLQRGIPHIWVEVDEQYRSEGNFPLVGRQIYTVFTGDIIPSDAERYIGTYQSEEGFIVYHVYC